jgi:Tfp pilus assembly protein PilV
MKMANRHGADLSSHISDKAWQRKRGSISPAHEQALQHHTIEWAPSSPDQKPVELHPFHSYNYQDSKSKEQSKESIYKLQTSPQEKIPQTLPKITVSCKETVQGFQSSENRSTALAAQWMQWHINCYPPAYNCWKFYHLLKLGSLVKDFFKTLNVPSQEASGTHSHSLVRCVWSSCCDRLPSSRYPIHPKPMQKLQISQKQIACCSQNLKLYRVPEQENQNLTMKKEVQRQWK